jgi:ubiquinol-cytochrome c reductase cytochrome b/c1 subunit
MADPLARFFDASGKVNADDATFFDDKTPVTRQQLAKDVAAFMMWAAEPHLEARKRAGLQVMFFLIVLTGLLYFTKKKVWASVAH